MIASRVFKNFLSLSSAGFVHSIVAVISTVYLARVLGPDGFGRMNFAFAFMQYFLILSAFGLDTVGVREVARNKERVKEYAGSILSLKLTLALLFFIILLATIPFLNRPEETNRLILLYGFVLFPSALFFEWTWQGLERMGNIGMSKIMRQLLYLGLMFVLVKNREDISFIPLIFLGVNILYAAILYLLFIRVYGPVKLKFDLNIWKELLKDSTPIGISVLLGIMVYSMNTVLLGFFRSDEEVGYYNAAFQVISFMLVFMCVFFDALFPTISNLYHTSIEKMEKILYLAGKTLMLITFPVAVGGTVLAPRLMHLLFGSKYDGGISALQMLIWVIVAEAINTIYARGLLAGNMQNYYLRVVALQVAILLLFNLALIRTFGIKGAVISTLAAHFVGFYYYYKGFMSIGNVQIYSTIIKPLAASMLMGGILLLCPSFNLFFEIIFGAILYFTGIYLLHGVERDEIAWATDRVFGRARGEL